MPFIALKCPSCGADINLDSSREFGFCSYCGMKIVQDKQVVQVKKFIGYAANTTVHTNSK